MTPKSPDQDAASKLAGDGSTYEEYGPQTVTLSDGTGDWSYNVTSKVSWTATTTTWTYTIVGVDGTHVVKNLSHVSLAGFDECFWNNLTTEGVTLVDEGNTGCVEDKDTQVIKTPGTSPNMTLTFTFNKVLKVNLEAATMYVKSATSCLQIVVPGPACGTLGLSGNVKQNICVDNDSQENLNYEGVTVTATQGSDVRTTQTDAEGNYSFDNLGGSWEVVPAGGVAQVVEIGPDDGVANFVVENRPNGSCAMIIGHADKTDCLNQSETFGNYQGATVDGGDLGTTTTDENGNFAFYNVPVGSHSIAIGDVSHDISVDVNEGTYDAGIYSFDFSGPICGGDYETDCSLSQGYWFANPKAVWPGPVVIGGYSYSQEEGKAIWNTSNKGGLKKAKAAFLQAAAIKLSGSSVSPSASVWADVDIIDAYFASLGKKITPSTIPANSKTGDNFDAGEAAGRIGDWINENHCAETK